MIGSLAWPMSAFVQGLPGQTHVKKGLLALSLLCLPGGSHAAQNPNDYFCRRWGHQTTVIDDKIYIDGGYLYYPSLPTKTNPNTWLGYHDLNNLTTGQEPWPTFNISLNTDPNNVPTVAGGVLWGDSVNKRFYVFGGEDTSGLTTSDFTLHSYDIAYNKWDNYGEPDIGSLKIASYGAGVGISETGQGYYYGGWITNASMKGWTQGKTMSSAFYKFEYDTNKTTAPNTPDDGLPRAEGAMVWIPAGDSGLLVYFGGLVDSNKNNDPGPQSLDEIFIFDPSSNTWYTQNATGDIPHDRRRFCAGAAWAPDRSSYNIYIYGGMSIPPVTDASAFGDMYILSLPSFTWVKIYPPGNSTTKNGKVSASCNMVRGNSQMFVIGGDYPDMPDKCDAQNLGQHSMLTGTKNNTGPGAGDWWAAFSPNLTTATVPKVVSDIVGGGPGGGATVLAPAGGFTTAGGATLATLFSRKPTFAARKPTRDLPGDGGGSNPGPRRSLSGGAIAGIAVGVVAAVCLGAFLAWRCCCGVAGAGNRREDALEPQRQGDGHPPQYHSGNDAATTVSRPSFLGGGLPSELSSPSVEGRWSAPEMQQQWQAQQQQQQYHHQQQQQVQARQPYRYVSPQPPAELEAQGGASPAGLGVVSNPHDMKKSAWDGHTPSPPLIIMDEPTEAAVPSPSELLVERQ